MKVRLERENGTRGTLPLHSLDDQTVAVRGHIDAVELRADGTRVLVGWAHDPGNPDDLLSVELVEGTTALASGRTGEYRADLKKAGFGDGFCGLTIPLPEGLLEDQQEHKLHLRLAGTDMAITSPKAIRNSDYVSHIDGVDGGVLKGWALSPADPGTPLQIDIMVNGTFVDRVVADQSRPDVPKYYGNLFCGFRWPLPSQLEDGQTHQIGLRVANTTVVLPEHATYLSGQAYLEPLTPSLTEIPAALREERRYIAFIDDYYRRSRFAIEAITADAVIYGGHAPHEFAALLARHFLQAHTAPLDAIISSPTESVGSAVSILYILHMDLAVFIARCLTGAGNRFFAERIRSAQPTILVVESPDQDGGLENLDLDRARLWCDEILCAARSAGMTATLESTLINFFFGHPGFVLSFRPAIAEPASA